MKRPNTLITIAILMMVCLLGQAQASYAWGQLGHRTIGLIAQKHLKRKARKKIRRILHHESLGIASTWMDDIKSDSTFDYAYPWHYVTIPTGKTYESSEKNKEGDVIAAIEKIIQALKEDQLTIEQERQQLRFLVHLVGDIHQPLHVGNGKDRGGNDIKVKFFWEESNLHRVWDSDMIDKKQLSYTELAAAIDHVHKDELRNWQKDDVRLWAMESMNLREQVYQIPEDKNIRYHYLYHNFPTVQKRLLQAGIRLAGILNEIYG